MGLDMNLIKKTYFGNNFRDPKDQIDVIIPKSSKATIKKERIIYIVEIVAYWRKAYQIHDWFVQNVQKGNDDCKEYYVSREQLKKLIEVCKEDLKKIEEEGYKTENLALTPTEGDFFGRLNVDEYFVEKLKETIKQLEPLILEETGDFYYQSSW